MAALIVFGLGLGSARATENESTQSTLNDGYSLFYNFCDQESQLSLLFWFKSAPHDISDYATRISSTAKDDMATLKKFAAHDSSIRLDKNSLPPFEVSVRASMAADRKQQLIWDDSGARFTQAICMTQSDVTNYGLHVAKVLSETDPDPDRAKAMGVIYKKWLAFHAEAYQLAAKARPDSVLIDLLCTTSAVPNAITLPTAVSRTPCRYTVSRLI